MVSPGIGAGDCSIDMLLKCRVTLLEKKSLYPWSSHPSFRLLRDEFVERNRVFYSDG